VGARGWLEVLDTTPGTAVLLDCPWATEEAVELLGLWHCSGEAWLDPWHCAGEVWPV